MKPQYKEGFLEENLERCQSSLTCDGGCECHTGETRVVRVISRQGNEPYDWGYYRYCDEAISEDIRRGLIVLNEGDKGFLPNEIL